MSKASMIRWIAATLLKLPPRQMKGVALSKDIAAPMRDGTTLLVDRYYSPGMTRGSVVLMRSPYGRGALFGIMAGLFAERGLQVVIQSVRGTGGSSGKFDPMRQEQNDGIDTIEWLRAQPWFSGQLFTFGVSYLGNAQWAMADQAADKIDGFGMAMTLSNFRDELQSFGGVTLAGTLSWTHLMQPMVDFDPAQPMQRPDPHALDKFHDHLPLGTMDQAAFGKRVSWWQDWINRDDPDDTWWQAIDHSAAASKPSAPITMVAGWQDVFLPFQLKDFAARQAAGKPTWLTIGPWSHISLPGMFIGMKQALLLFHALNHGQQPYADRAPVRVYLQGANVWREYTAWPPPDSRPMRWHLRADNLLTTAAATADEGAVRYTYDPGHPTPAVHGPMVMKMAKQRDMTLMEQRNDTVSFTSATLDRDLDVIGPVSVELSIKSDREHTDFYVCLCDVDKKRRPLQVVDGYLRLRPSKPTADVNGVRRITIECWPTAYRFKRGHQLRLIIASGAHPRYARNLGTGEPAATATRMVNAHQQILLGAVHGSMINLLVSG